MYLPSTEIAHDNINWLDPVSEHPLNDGLVSWWLAIQNQPGWKSSQWLDLCDPLYGNHGTLTNMDPATDWVGSSRPGGWGALDFDGVDDIVTIGTSVIHADSGKPFTVSAWCYLNDFTPNIYPKILTLYSDTTSTWELTLSSRNSYLGVLIGSEADWARLKSDTASARLMGQWLHVAVTYNGAGAGTAGNFSGYLDGAPLTFSAAGPFSALGNSTAIGAPVSGGSTNRWDGQLDNIRIYNRALSATEVQAQYFDGLNYNARTLNRIWTPRYKTAAAIAAVFPFQRYYQMQGATL